MFTQRILSILPRREGFSTQHSGAIALCVRDFTVHSRYRKETLVCGGASYEGFPDIQYQKLPNARWFENRSNAYIRHIAALIKKEKPSLVEVHNRPRILLALANRAAPPLALHLHNDPQEMSGAKTAHERSHLLEKCTAIYCVSQYVRDRFMQGLPAQHADKLHVIYNGIALPTARPPKDKQIVFAGRMTEEKGALPLAQAMCIALPQLDGWGAVMIGGKRHAMSDDLSPYEQQVMEALAPLGRSVRLTGFIPHAETMSIFARSEIAVIPSLWQEPFGRTALEAMVSGAALISSGTGGLPEVTADAALSLKEVNAKVLAEAILLLARDAGKRQQLQQLGLARASIFAIDRTTRALDDVRETILGASHAA